MASSPVQEVPEEDMDLWDQASLDYPGRFSPGRDGFDEFDDFIEDGRDDIIFYDEPRYHTWHVILLGLTWLMAIGMGKISKFMTQCGKTLNKGNMTEDFSLKALV